MNQNALQRGAAWMVTAILLLSTMDVGIKFAANHVSTWTIMWVRYSAQTLVLGAFLLATAQPLFATHHPKLQAIRGLILLVNTAFFMTAIRYLPLADMTALIQLSPLFIALGGFLFLGEKLGPARLLGIGAALLGALIVVRPGSSIFTWAALLPIAGALSYSVFALTTRYLRAERPMASLFLPGLIIAVLLTVAWPIYGETIPLEAAPALALVAICGTTAHFCLIRAFSTAEAGAIAPLGYSGLIFATVYGALFFEDFPDLWTCVGAIVIVVAGLYVWHRERKQVTRT